MKPLSSLLETQQQPITLNRAYAHPLPRRVEPASLLHVPNDEPCPICGGVGFVRRDVPVGHPDFGKAVLCQCRRGKVAQENRDALRRTGNLDVVAHLTFDTFIPDGLSTDDKQLSNTRMAYQMAREYADNPNEKPWLILLGGYGCGKTHLAAAIANQVIAQGQEAFFMVVPDLLDHLRAAFSPHSTVPYDVKFEQIRETPLLILDDLGTQNSSSWALEKLYQLFNYRYNMRLPTVVTSNLSLDAVDPRISSRLQDLAISELFVIQSRDFRQGAYTQDSSNLSQLANLHQDKTFATFSTFRKDLSQEHLGNLERAFELAYNYAQQPRGWLVFSGTYGCGKTHLAAAIANEQSNRGVGPLFISVPDFLDYLRGAYSPDSVIGYDKRFDEVRRAPLLVLDDLGSHSSTAWAEEKMYQLFSYRYHASLPTIITMTEDSKVHPRLKSMILDTRRCIVYAITVPSYRGMVPAQPKPTKSLPYKKWNRR